MTEAKNKGDPKSIVTFLEKQRSLSEESAKNITDALEKGRRSTIVT